MGQDRLQILLQSQAAKRNRQKNQEKRPEDSKHAIAQRAQNVQHEYMEMDRETASILRNMMDNHLDNRMDTQISLSNDLGIHMDMQDGYPNGYTRLTNQIIAKTGDNNFKNINPSGHLSKNESLIWSLICELKDFTLKAAQIAKFTGVSLPTTRKILYRFRESDLIELTRPEHATYNSGLYIKKLVTLASEITIPSLNIKNKMVTQSPLVVSKEVETTTSYENIKEINEEYIAEYYPALYEIGFGQNQIEQCIQFWKDNKKHFSVESLKLSLSHAEWFVENKKPDKKGGPIRNYLDYIFVLLKKNASFRTDGFQSTEAKLNYEKQKKEKEEEALLQEQQAIKDKQKMDSDIASWIQGMTEIEKQELIVKLNSDITYNIYKTDEKKLGVYWMLNNIPDEKKFRE